MYAASADTARPTRQQASSQDAGTAGHDRALRAVMPEWYGAGARLSISLDDLQTRNRRARPRKGSAGGAPLVSGPDVLVRRRRETRAAPSSRAAAARPTRTSGRPAARACRHRLCLWSLLAFRRRPDQRDEVAALRDDRRVGEVGRDGARRAELRQRRGEEPPVAARRAERSPASRESCAATRSPTPRGRPSWPAARAGPQWRR